MQTPPEPPVVPADALTIHTAPAAALIAHPGRRRILFALAGRDRSLAEVAVEAQMQMNLLHYHVHRMLHAGLLPPRKNPPRGKARAAPLRRPRSSSRPD